MHIKRKASSIKLPLARKGTKYIARAFDNHTSAVPVIIAVRDLLNLAKTRKEVLQMIKNKVLKINGRLVRDPKESIKMFNIFEAGKKYVLTLLPTGKFVLKETKEDSRIGKIIGKKLVGKNRIQFNLHDGTNFISSEKMTIGDSVYLDFSGKIKKHVSFEKGKEAFVLSGKYVGLSGKITEVRFPFVTIKLEGKEENAVLPTCSIIVR